MGVSIWWKKYLTTMQITQFVLDIVACYYYTYSRIQTDSCGNGEVYAAYFGSFLLTSYLFLFINFFNKTYKDDKPKKSKTQ